MPTQTISCGPVTAVTQNTVFALPPVRALLTCDTVAATFVHSNDVAFGVSAPLALSAAGEVEVGGGFIKLTSAGPVNVVIKRA